MSKISPFKTVKRLYFGFAALFLALAGCNFPDPFFIPVTAIEGVPTTGTAGTPLTLTATVRPEFANNSGIVWLVVDAGTTGASISGNVLNTDANGTAIIKAKIANGKGEGKDYTHNFTIVFSGGLPAYTVHFETNGGGNIADKRVTEGQTAARPAVPFKSGFVFENWYSDAELTALYDFNTPVTTDITLYAKWLAIAGISIKTQPSKLDYTSGETLDLAGLVVTISYEDGAAEDVEYFQFVSKGITAIPAHGTALSLSTHHDTAVLISAGNYSAATNKLTVTKAAGAAVGIPSASWNFASKTITVTAVTAPANGQSVEYAFSTSASANPASLAWAVGKLTFTNADDGIANDTTYYIYARSASNENYNTGAASISEGITTSTITVPVTGVTLNKASASLTVGGTETLTQTVAPSNATNKTVTWESSDTAVATVNNGTVTAVSAGTAVITVKTADGGFTAMCTVTVSLASAADVTFPTAAAITYGAALSTSILSGGSAGRGTFVWQTPSTIPTVTNSGYLMEFTPTDGLDYSGITGWDGSKVVRTVAITVNKKSVTITPATGQSKTHGTADPTFEYTPSEALLSGNTFSGALAYTGTNVGTYPFTLGTLSAGNNYTLVLGGSVTFAINKAAGAAVSTPAVSTGTPPTSDSITVNAVTLQTATGQSVEYAILTVNNGSPTSWQSGTTFSGLTANTTYYVYARSASNTNYNAGTASVSAGIKTALASAADVTFPTAAAITYGAALSTSALSGGSAGRGSFTWQTPSTIPTVTNSGYLMEFTPTDGLDYSGITGWNGSKVVRTIAITVNKKSVTITPATGQSKTYGAADPTFEYTPSESLLSGNAFSGALAYTGTNVGTYPFTLGTLSAGNNYTLVLGGSITFAITKAAGVAVGIPTVSGTPTSTSITVNVVTLQTATGQSIEYAISTANDGTGLSAYQSGTVFTGLNANTTYYVYARSASNANYNEGTASVSAGIKTALASAADVTFPTAAAITYGAALSTSTLNGGSAGRGSFTWQTPSTIPTVTNSGYLMEFTPNDSYDYSAVDGWNGSKVVRTVAITVNKKTVTITPAMGQSKTYGAADPTFEYTPSETLLSGNTFIGVLAYTGTNVGTYPFTLGTLSAGDNYTLVLGGSVTFAITKAAGAAVGIPTVSGTPTSTSITVNTVAAPGNGQTVEYAILTVNNGSPTSWQNGTAFSGLTANTTYYVYARSASNANYNEGTANVSAGIKTALASAADVTFPTAAAITYGAALSTSTLSGGSAGRGTFVWQTPSTIPTVTNNGYLMEFTPNDSYDYSGISGWDGDLNKVVRTVAITVNKAAGAAVTTPTVSSSTPPTSNSITVNVVTLQTATGQSIEYAISTASDGTGLSAYQSGTTFSGLNANATYYVYARSASNTNYNEGTANVSAGIKTDNISIEMVLINAGTFMMGSPTTETGRSSEETQHQVRLTKDFYMGKYEVTQEQYQAVMGSNPSNFTTTVSGESGTPGKLPVERVSWYDAIVFCNTLSIMEGKNPVYSMSGSTDPSVWGTVPTNDNSTWDAVIMVSGANGYRLPTEAEWEYACRAETTTAYNTGASINNNTGWYYDNSGNKTHQVGLKPLNAWGLYDMHGNVNEWCWDWYYNNYYSNSPADDPEGVVSSSNRVLRGGKWNDAEWNVRSAGRFYNNPSTSSHGFRLVRSAQ